MFGPGQAQAPGGSLQQTGFGAAAVAILAARKGAFGVLSARDLKGATKETELCEGEPLCELSFYTEQKQALQKL